MKKLLLLGILFIVFFCVLSADPFVSGTVTEGGQCQNTIKISTPLYWGKAGVYVLITVIYDDAPAQEFERWTDQDGNWSVDESLLTGTINRFYVDCMNSTKMSRTTPFVANFHCP